MKIVVDADACPQVIKEILYRAAKRLKIPLTLVANQPLRIPLAPNIKFVLVGRGFDIADKYIVSIIAPGDLVITADIPLASEVVDKQAFALNPRGEFYTSENVKQKLATRNLMEALRGMGRISGGPAPFDRQDQQAFANALDTFLAKH
jgi:uncharacterized protein YaiI (UPF0178 family)